MIDTRRGATIAIALCVAFAVAAGLFISGGPGRARKEARDDHRLRDLRQISANIRCQAQTSGRVADTPQLTDLCPRPFTMQNPNTGENYTYIRIDDRNWRICASFELPDRIRPRDGAQFDAKTGCLLGNMSARQRSGFPALNPLLPTPQD
ncbi:hypothetical protein [Paracoccus xiamenensis]|uniref:hypothetical protein n=1 Tax=Paracoccus xiamenensis TaxID=2714901 RepID=UPI001407B24C|nr:hypothetical protein [Paracoccus xiamenensis]NHF72136.1 hypothetical protein [Paracoccus xiamenensis]